MPLRILKRNCKQYNVVSKSTFVISVELLDNGVMECTLDAESTGRDCLLNVSQRLGLHQPEFFGLRYISRGVPPRQRWVELDRPLRKQLEKNAQDSQLSLGVMFYVNDVNLLKDEMARYHYFLQLKSDVIDGKLNCSIEQAISLAAYSLQAEFGDFDPERHTVEYLRDFAILPKDLISEQKYPQINVDGLYEAVVRQYASLIGFPPPLAEIYYIMVSSSLDGCGQEPYPAKDDAGNDILICVSANGLIIRRRDWTHIAAFRWVDIKSLLGHKRLFVVESSQSHRTMQYHFTDAEVAKYVRKMCLLQSSFHKDSNTDTPPQQTMQTGGSTYSSRSTSLNMSAASSGAQIPVTMMNLDQIDVHGAAGQYFPGVTPDLLQAPTLQSSGATSHSSLNVSSTFNHSGLSLNSSSGFHYSLPPQHLHSHQMQVYPPTQPHQLQQMEQQQQLLFHHPGELYNQMHMMPNVRTNPLAAMPLQVNNDHELYSNGYGRAVSDYTAALQQKYGNMIPGLTIPRTSSQLYFSGENQNQSQDVQKNSLEEEPIYQNEIVSQMHTMELRDSLSNSAADVNGNPSSSSTNLNINRNTSPAINTAISTPTSQAQNSTMILSQLQTSQSKQEETHPQYLFKPPPPYPGLGVGLNNSNLSSQQSKSNLLHNSNQTMSASSSNTNSNSSLSTNTKEIANPSGIMSKNTQMILPSSMMSKLSPSAISAIVSAQVHSEPLEGFKPIATNNKQNTLILDNKTLKQGVELENGAYEIVEFLEKIDESQSHQNPISSTNSSSMLDSCVTTTTTAIRESPVVMKPTIASCTPDKIQGEAEGKPKNKAGHLFGKPIDPSVLREFQAIPKTKSNPNFATALKRENSKRNRTPDIVPYEDNIIRLNPTRQNPTGYINASPLSVMIGEKKWLYTVAQLPLAGNAPSLWQMIWESEIKVIVSLDRDSNALFYPLKKGVALTFNDFQVIEGKGERRNSSSPTIAREFTLTFIPKKKQRKVWVLPYEEEWRDDVPLHTEHFLCFLEEVNSIQRKVSEPSSSLTVICNTGSGRSGIFLLSDLLLHAADCGHKLRCDSLLNELRTQRMSLVTTASQYAFVLHTLAKYLAQSRLI